MRLERETLPSPASAALPLARAAPPGLRAGNGLAWENTWQPDGSWGARPPGPSVPLLRQRGKFSNCSYRGTCFYRRGKEPLAALATPSSCPCSPQSDVLIHLCLTHPASSPLRLRDWPAVRGKEHLARSPGTRFPYARVLSFATGIPHPSLGLFTLLPPCTHFFRTPCFCHCTVSVPPVAVTPSKNPEPPTQTCARSGLPPNRRRHHGTAVFSKTLY